MNAKSEDTLLRGHNFIYGLNISIMKSFLVVTLSLKLLFLNYDNYLCHLFLSLVYYIFNKGINLPWIVT